MLRNKSHVRVQTDLRFYAVFIAVALFANSESSPIDDKKNVCDSAICQAAAKNLKDSIDTNADPCDNFYQYACGNWPNTHRIQGADIATETILVREEINKKEILDYLKKSNDENEPEAVHKARKLFSLCLNDEGVYKNGIKPIKNMLTQIGLRAIPPFGRFHNRKYDYIKGAINALKLFGTTQFYDISVEPNLYNETLNVITISTPTSWSAVRGASRRRSNIAISTDGDEASESLYGIEYWKQAVIKMCEQSNAAVCKILSKSSPPYKARQKRLYNYLMKYENRRDEIISQTRSEGNVTASYRIYSLQELQNRTDAIVEHIKCTNVPKFNWTKCIELLFSDVENVTIDLSDPAKIQIAIYEMDFVEDMIKFIHSSTLKEHEIGLWWSLVSEYLPYVDVKTAEIAADDNDDGSPAQTSEESCAEFVNSYLAMATSYYYTTTPIYNKTKIEIREMVNNIKENMIDLMNQSSWMDNESKQNTVLKLKSMKSMVAFPSSIKNSRNLDDFYKYFEIKDDWLETTILSERRDRKQSLSKYNQLNDPNEDRWPIAPNEVNAFYLPQYNTITIPAGILGMPVYCNSMKALDYGGVGFIVGHELAHGFDNTGRRYNSVGNIDDSWWKPETLATYRKKVECLVEDYENYELHFNNFVLKGNNIITLGENIADFGGFKEALLAYRNYVSKYGEEPLLTQFENYTHEQLFTLGFANVWCESLTDYSASVAELSDHSPNGIRVNVVLKNSEEFSNIWKCPKGSNMNPDKKCSIW